MLRSFDCLIGCRLWIFIPLKCIITRSVYNFYIAGNFRGAVEQYLNSLHSWVKYSWSSVQPRKPRIFCPTQLLPAYPLLIQMAEKHFNTYYDLKSIWPHGLPFAQFMYLISHIPSSKIYMNIYHQSSYSFHYRYRILPRLPYPMLQAATGGTLILKTVVFT